MGALEDTPPFGLRAEWISDCSTIGRKDVLVRAAAVDEMLDLKSAVSIEIRDDDPQQEVTIAAIERHSVTCAQMAVNRVSRATE
jgi:hypothetical protein